MAGQSKKHSAIEVITGTVVGYCVAVCTQILIFPLFNIHVAHSENFALAAIFTIISLIRGYLLRRVFNYIHVKMNQSKRNVS